MMLNLSSWTITTLFLLSLSLFFNFNPITKGFLILIQTPFFCLMTLYLNKNSWMSLILFLAFLGGILILFAYILSLIENEVIYSKLTFFFTPMIVLFALLTFLSSKEILPSLEIFSFSNKMSEMKLILFLFSKSYYKTSIFFIIYLFLTMISVLKLINTKKNNSLN